MRSPRRRRTRTRKPKFLSLRRQLAPPTSPETTQLADPTSPDHPFQHIDDEEQSPRSLFNPDYEVETTLNSLLGINTTTSFNYGLPCHGGLAKAALRGRERWVFCREEEEEEGEASSTAAAAVRGRVDLWNMSQQRIPCLKLDYDEILSAWSGKGCLFIAGEGHQVVPQLHNYHQQQYSPHVFVDVGGSSATSGASTSSSSSSVGRVAEKGKMGGSREERVMRYREKRRSRLFSKKIRYEVRKLNA